MAGPGAHPFRLEPWRVSRAMRAAAGALATLFAPLLVGERTQALLAVGEATPVRRVDLQPCKVDAVAVIRLPCPRRHPLTVRAGLTLAAVVGLLLGPAAADSAAQVTVSVEGGSATEGSAVSFKVKLSEAVSSNVVVSISTTDDDTEGARQATAGTDYQSWGSTRTILAGNTESAAFSVTTLADTDIEGDETFKVQISERGGDEALPPGVEIGTATAVGTIVDDDAVTVSVETASATEGSALSFTVRLSQATSADVVLGWSTGDDDTSGAQQATAGTDYTAVTGGSVTIAASQTTGTLTVQTTADTVGEANETFKVTVTGTTLPAGVFMGTTTAVGTIVDDDDAVRVSVEAAWATEGSALPFTVRLSKAANADVVLGWSTGNDGTSGAQRATAGTDYTAVTGGSATITAGQTTATLTVQTTADAVGEPNETFKVTITGTTLPAGVVIGDAMAVGTIVDDDSVRVSIIGGSAVEGSPVTFTVRLSKAFGSDLQVDISTAVEDTEGPRSATKGVDYPATGSTAFFAAGRTEATFSVRTIQDTDVEGDETFKVRTSEREGKALPAGVFIETATAVGTIVDDDAVNVSVEAASATEGLALSFTVRLSKAASSAVVLGWSTGDDDTSGAQQATAGTDYTAVTGGSVTIAAGQTTAPLTVQTTADAVGEADETFKVTISGTTLPAGVFMVTTMAVGTIVDDDDVRVSIEPASATEGSALSFTVRLSKAADAEVVLGWSTGDDDTSGSIPAVAGTDYTAVTGGSVTVAASQTTATLTVQTTQDADGERDETFKVTITGTTLPQGVVIVTAVAVGTIVNDDAIADVSILAASAVEGSPVIFPVLLSQPIDSDLVVTVSATEGGGGTRQAEADVDFTSAAFRATIPAGKTVMYLSVPTTADNDAEGDETFWGAVYAHRHERPRGVSFTANPRAVGTIEDDDATTVSVGPASAVEGSALAFPVQLTRAAASNIVLGWTTSDHGTANPATANTDYTAVTSGSVTITAGATTATLTVQTTADTTGEGNEIFQVTITGSTLPEGVFLGTDTAVGTILDDDQMSSEISIEPAFGRTEGGPVGFKVKLTQAVASDVVLGWSTGDDDTAGARQAMAGTDYTVVTGASETITPGQTEVYLRVGTRDDSFLEGDETFKVTITGTTLPTGVSIATATAVGTIVDDEAVRVSVEPATATEGSPLSFKVRLTQPVASGLELGWFTGDDEAAGGNPATAGMDYTAVTGGKVKIAPGQSAATLTVQTTADYAVEGDETFKVTITGTSLPTGVSIRTATARGTVEDGDVAAVSVEAASAAEGSAVSFPVRLSSAVGSDVVLGWSTGNDDTSGAQQATAGTDYTAVTGGSVTIAAGQTSAVLTVQTTADSAAEGDETFKVTITGTTLPTGVSIRTAMAVGTIEDDDVAAVSVEAASATEGSAVSFPVRLSSAVGSDVVLGWSTGDDPSGARQAMAGTDYTAVTGGSVTIAAGQTSATLTVQTTADSAVEGDETFQVTITGTTLPAGAIIRTSTAVGTIVDDEAGGPLATGNRPPTVSASCKPCRVVPGGELTLTAMASDPDGDRLTYAWSATAGSFGGEIDGAIVRWTAPDATAPATISVHVSDGRGGSTSAMVTIRVTSQPQNEPPEAVDDEAATDEDQVVTVDVLANDTDPDGDALRVGLVAGAAHGTTAVTGGGVQYTPAANYHGMDRFTYVVSDGNGGTAEAAVEMTVVPVNDAPMAVGVIPDQVLNEGSGAKTLELRPFFEDVDGDALAYRVVVSEPSVAAAVSGAVLTLVPVEYGDATVSVTAEDEGGLTATQTFSVGVSDRLARGAVADALAGTARSHLASARMMLGRRVAASPTEASQVTVLGRAVPLGKAAASAQIEHVLAAWLSVVLPHGSSGGGPGRGARPGSGFGGSAVGSAVPGGLPGAGGSLGAPGAGAGFGARGAGALSAGMIGAAASGMGRPGTAGHGGVSGDVGSFGGFGGGADPLRASDFVLALGGGQDGVGARRGRRWQVWGQGDVQTFRGAPSDAIGYGGQLRTAYLGVDTWLTGRWMAGVAVARSAGDGDWRAGGARGALETTLTAVHPYVLWSDGTTSVWATAGGGWGEAENQRATGRRGVSGLGLRLGLVELRRRLGSAGGVQFGVRADAAWAELRTEAGEETIDSQMAAVRQVRVGAKVSRPVRLGGLTLAPFTEVHVRRDGGVGQTGEGVEVAGGARAMAGMVKVDAQGRLLVVHSAAAYRERGVGLTLGVGSQNEEGLSLSVSPRWGDSPTGGGALWQEQAYRQYVPAAVRDEWEVDARGGYGLRLPGGRLLIWFGTLKHSPYGRSFLIGAQIGAHD